MVSSALYAQKNTIIKGYADFSIANPELKKNIPLNGEWAFYPNELLSPKDFTHKDTLKTSFIKVPSLWNGNSNFPQLATGKGFATYRAKIKLPKADQLLAIRILGVESAYKLWINGDIIIASGKVATSSQEMHPARHSITKIFEAQEELDIIIQVSNFKHRNGGIKSQIIIGNAEQVTSYSASQNNIDTFLLGVLLIMAIYHISLFLLRRTNKSALYLGVLLLSLMLNISVNSEQTLGEIFTQISWSAKLHIDFISHYAASIFMLLFFRSLYPSEFKKWVLIASYIILGLLLAVTLAFPPVVFTEFLIVFEIYIILLILYILYTLTKAIFKRKDGVIFNFIGTVIVLFAVVNDILVDMLVISSIRLLPGGIFAFVFFQTYMLSRNFSNMFNKTDELNLLMSNLDKIKNNLLTASTFNLKATVKILIENTNADRGLLFIITDGKAILNTICRTNQTQEQLTDTQYPTAIIEKVTQSKSTVLVENPLKKLHYFTQDYLETYAPKSILCVPLIASNKIKAIIYLENFSQTKAFNSDNVKVLELLTNQILALKDNATIYGSLNDANKGLEDTVQHRISEINNQKEELLAQRDEIDNQKSFLDKTYSKISKQHTVISERIQYAKGIQETILPPNTFLSNIFADAFVYYKPKEELSGDFYWGQVKGENILFATVDCTGHGVPGALMSIVGSNLLNAAVNIKQLSKPSEILDYMQQAIRVQLKQSGEKNDSNDGMDLSLINYNPETKALQFAGARNYGFLLRNKQITEIKADRMSIGGAAHARISKEKCFTNQRIQIEKNDQLYLFSDGYIDQLGGSNGRRIMKRSFKTLLLSICELSMSEQLEIINSFLKKWQGESIQNDDILVTGIKF